MRTVRRILVVLLLLCAMTAFAAPKYTIYLLGVDPGTDPAFIGYYAGVKQAQKMMPDVKIVYVGMTADDLNPTGITNKLEQCVAARPNGIVTGFWIMPGMEEPALAAIKMGIPIIAYNQPDTRPAAQRVPYLGFVGVQAYDIGAAMANEALKRMNIKRAAISIHHAGSASLEDEASGIASVLQAKKIPFDKVETTTTTTTAMNVLSAYVNKYPDTNFIFTLGVAGEIPAMQFIREKNLKGKVFMAGYEVNQEVASAIKDGTILFAIEHQSFTQTFYPLVEMYNYLEYGILPLESLLTGPIIVDKSNVGVFQKQLDTIWK